MIVKDIAQLVMGSQDGDKMKVAEAACSLTFDALSLALGITGTVAGLEAGGAAGVIGAAATLSAAASALAIPLAGIAFGVGGLVKAVMQSIASADEFLHYLGFVYNAYNYKGYLLNKEGMMVANIDANIVRIDFRAGELEFGETRLMGNTHQYTLTPLRITRE